MPYDASLLATVVISLAFAYAAGLASRLLRLPPLVGYLAAGIIVGPYTPGFIADPKLTTELADIGVALLLFSVGLHFSIRDLIAVWHIAVPGALLQIVLSTAVGFGLGLLLGWTSPASLILGLAVAIASTAVATRALAERGQLDGKAGQIALGWLVVQDIVVILALVLLPIAARGPAPGVSLVSLVGQKLLGFAIFAGLVLVIGRRLLPALLAFTARTGAQELFTLGVIVLALGIAYGSSVLLGISLALGAFFAGVVLGESDLSHQAAAESVPIQSVFTVLFFVSIGMLFDPGVLLRMPLEVAALLGAIIVGMGGFTLLILLGFGVHPTMAAAVAGALAQIGEFSFIVTELGFNQGMVSAEQRTLLLAGALLAILVNPLVVWASDQLAKRLERAEVFIRRSGQPRFEEHWPGQPRLKDHAIVVGFGHIGQVVTRALQHAGRSVVVVEWRRHLAELARSMGLATIYGDATRERVFNAAHPRDACLVVIVLPDAFQTRRVVELARAANPDICMVARAHSDEEVNYLKKLGAGTVIMDEREIALSMSDFTLRQMGFDAGEAQAVVDALRSAMPGEEHSPPGG